MKSYTDLVLAVGVRTLVLLRQSNFMAFASKRNRTKVDEAQTAPATMQIHRC